MFFFAGCPAGCFSLRGPRGAVLRVPRACFLCRFSAICFLRVHAGLFSFLFSVICFRGEGNLFFRGGFPSPRNPSSFQHCGIAVAGLGHSPKPDSLEQAVYCTAASLCATQTQGTGVYFFVNKQRMSRGVLVNGDLQFRSKLLARNCQVLSCAQNLQLSIYSAGVERGVWGGRRTRL